MSVRTIIVGATGYTGAELVGLLAHHPGVELVGLFGSEKRTQSIAFENEFPRYRGLVNAMIEPMDLDILRDRQADAVFLATPHAVSAELAYQLRGSVDVVVDLSAAFRVPNPAFYPQWYNLTHADNDLLAGAVYALVEHNRPALLGADLLAVPGCYPTASLLGLLPVAKAGGLARGGFVSINGISGVSGAGRAPSVPNLFSEVSLRPYGVSGHRHQPEIEHHLQAADSNATTTTTSIAPSPGVLFTPHVGPWDRGMVVTSHVKLVQGWDAAKVRNAYEQAYPRSENPFVRMLPADHWPSVAAVEHTNFCDIAWHYDAGHQALVVTSAIDNLVKGAAGQAVQAFNVRIGFEETQGLLPQSNPLRVAVGGAL